MKIGGRGTIFNLDGGKGIILCHHTMTQLLAKLLLLHSFCKLFCSVSCLIKPLGLFETIAQLIAALILLPMSPQCVEVALAAAGTRHPRHL